MSLGTPFGTLHGQKLKLVEEIYARRVSMPVALQCCMYLFALQAKFLLHKMSVLCLCEAERVHFLVGLALFSTAHIHVYSRLPRCRRRVNTSAVHSYEHCMHAHVHSIKLSTMLHSFMLLLLAISALWRLGRFNACNVFFSLFYLTFLLQPQIKCKVQQRGS